MKPPVPQGVSVFPESCCPYPCPYGAATRASGPANQDAAVSGSRLIATRRLRAR
jgi:hypothetical protein